MEEGIPLSCNSFGVTRCRLARAADASSLSQSIRSPVTRCTGRSTATFASASWTGDWRPARAEEIRAAFGAEGGSLGPVGVELEIVADEALREGQFVTGANRTGRHLRGVEAGRDWTASRWADLRVVEEGDLCPEDGGALELVTAIEVGNIFKLGTRYSEPLGANFLDEDG